MKCPLCQVELRITNSRNVVENDDTPDKPTKLYVEQDLSCLNKKCVNYNTVVETVRNELEVAGQETIELPESIEEP
jgi:hypothetical protein